MKFETASKALLKIASQGIEVDTYLTPSFGGLVWLTVFPRSTSLHDYKDDHQIELLAHHGFMPVHSHYQPVKPTKNA